MNIYENNKQLLTTMGGDSANLATDYEVRKAILDLLGGDSSNCNSIYDVDKQILNIYLEGGGAGGGCDLTPITITENGTYSRERGGYSEVTVNVAGGDSGEKLKLNRIIFDAGSVVNGTIDMYNVYNKIDINYITIASEMFVNCYLLTHLNLSGFVTSRVSEMGMMFNGCFSLQALDVSGWDTSNVNNMYNMFYSCSSLQALDVSGWNTSNVTDMDLLFSECSSLQSLDVSGWDTNRVEFMNQMFSNCSSLTQLDLTNWNIASAIGIENFSAGSGIINYVGGRTIDDVIANNITILNGFRCNASGVMSAVADRASLRALINGLLPVPQDETDPDYGLYDSLGLYQSNLDTLTEEDIAVSTEKGWTLWAFE